MCLHQRPAEDRQIFEVLGRLGEWHARKFNAQELSVAGAVSRPVQNSVNVTEYLLRSIVVLVASVDEGSEVRRKIFTPRQHGIDSTFLGDLGWCLAWRPVERIEV